MITHRQFVNASNMKTFGIEEVDPTTETTQMCIWLGIGGKGREASIVVPSGGNVLIKSFGDGGFIMRDIGTGYAFDEILEVRRGDPYALVACDVMVFDRSDLQVKEVEWDILNEMWAAYNM
jgi:hypothetical protein